MKRILLAVLLFTALTAYLEDSSAVDDLKIPERTRYSRTLQYGDCCCGNTEWTLDRVYENQLINEARHKPSTLGEIRETYYKFSGGDR